MQSSVELVTIAMHIIDAEECKHHYIIQSLRIHITFPMLAFSQNSLSN